MSEKENYSDLGVRKGALAEKGSSRKTAPIEKASSRRKLQDEKMGAPVPPGSPLGQDSEDAEESAERKSLWPFYNTVSAFEYADPDRATRLLDEILVEGLDNYTAPPDTWHNSAMVAGRVRHRVAQMDLVEAGLREWPDNVDLLCDEMQYRQSTHYEPKKLAEIWDKLNSMDRRLTAPYWRFWVTGAGYYALELDQPAEALKLLDQGLLAVRRDALMDILRSYRRIFVDSIPMRKLRYRKQVIEQQAQVLKALEERYLVGIESGVENSYVLATDLARLYQEQAGLGQDQVDAPSDATGNDGANRRDEYLRKALDYLDLAEKLYTGNPNHPIWDIYEQRIRILMAQHRYGDAFKFLRCLPASRLRDPSLTTMLNLASQMTGERIEDEATLTTERVLDNLDTVMSVLLRNEADLLFQIASQNPSVQAALLAVLQRLRRE